MKLFASLVASLFVAIALHAQQYDYPVSIPITFNGVGVSGFGTGSFSVAIGGVGTSSGGGPGPGISHYSSYATGYLVPGKDYNVTVTSSNCLTVATFFKPVDGCTIYLNNIKRNGYSTGGTNYSFTVRVIIDTHFDNTGDFSLGLPDKRAGECTSFPEDKAFWYIGLGRMSNGQSAGAVGFRAGSITSTLFTPAALYYSAIDNSEVSVTRNGSGDITQVQAPEVVLNVTTLSSTSYTIDACLPSSPTTPFITYTISQYASGAGIQIDKLEDSITTSTALKYVSSTWTRYDWQNNSVFPAGNITTTAVSGLTSTVTSGSTTGGIVVKQKNYTTVNSNLELYSVVMGPSLSSPPTTTYSHYTSSTGSGWAQALQSVVEPTGAWTKYDYFNGSTDTRAGRIQRIYRPWLDAPTSPGSATTTNCYLETYDYANDFNGQATVPASKVIAVNGTTVGKTTWTYSWSSATVNSHTIAQIAQNDYSATSNYLTTTTLAYRDDDSSSFFRGRKHAVTRPDGTKDSYAYYLGTWNSSTNSFTPGSGNDRLILCFHGQAASGSGTTQITSWTIGSSSWTVEPLYLVNNLSTVTESVVDSNGRIAFNAENIYDGSNIERIVAHGYTFNGNNLLVTDQDLIRSVSSGDVSVGYSYTAGLLSTVTGVDGVQKTYGYDNYLRNTSIVSAYGGTGSYPATTQSFTYYDSGLKLTGQETARSPTTTTFTYETSGRGATSSEPQPGGGTLTTSYTYPSAVQATTTLPTNATKTTTLYLDGKLKELSGTGQNNTQILWSVDSSSGNITKTVQNGSSKANGWLDEQTDWLGRKISESAPQWGWTSSNNITVLKTYSYLSTGQLSLVCTQDSSTSGAYLVPPRRYEYGNLGVLVREGDDIDQSSSLTLASSDKITDYSTTFYKDTSGYNGWIRDDLTTVYRTASSSTDVATSHKYTRFTRFNNASLLSGARVLSDVEIVDTSGRSEIIWEWSDLSARTRTRSDSVQGATNAAVTVWQDGYLKSEGSASGVTKTYAYNSSGLLQSVTEATTNAQTSNSYHSGTTYLSSTTQTSAASAGTVTTSYAYSWNTTVQTNTVSVTDAASNIAYTEYDAKGQVIHAWGTAAQPAKTEYDSYGRRTAITTWQSGSFTGSSWPSPDPSGGNRVDWTADPATGAANSKTDAASKSVVFTYTALGQLATRTWARNVTTTYTYLSTSGNHIGQLQSIAYNDGTPSVSYTYTRLGLVDTISDSAGTRTLNYRTDLKLDNEAFDSSFYGSKTLTTTYDTGIPGRVTGYSYNGSNVTVSATVTYNSSTGRVATIAGAFGATTTTFTPSYASGTDWVSSVTNGSYTRSTPLATGCDVIDSATTSWGSTTMGQFQARYNDVRGCRTGEDSGSSSGTASGSWSKVLGLGDGLVAGTSVFDGYGQLTTVPTPSWQATTGSQSLSGRNFGWTYDLAGNRTAETGAAPTSYSPNALNQYSSITGTLWEGSPSYDDDGNLTLDGTWVYTYDGENRLHSMSRSGQTLTFVYDYIGRRIRKTVTGTSASDTKFLWNGWKLAAELAANGTTVNRTFVWGADFSDAQGPAGGAGSLLAQIDGGTVTYAMPDVHGNIVGYLNGSGAFDAAVEYSPYGRVLNSTGSVTNYPIGYSGQYTDWETGLVYYGLRYYSSKHGRFINRDPIEEQGGLNLYGFCRNDPVNGFDLLGCIDPYPSGMPQWARDIVTLTMGSFAGRSGCNLEDFGADWLASLRMLDWADTQEFRARFEAEHVWDKNGRLVGPKSSSIPAPSSASSGTGPRNETTNILPIAYEDREGNWRSIEDNSLINGGRGYGASDSGLDKGDLAAALDGAPELAANGNAAVPGAGGPYTVTQKMTVTAYCDKGTGSDWAYYSGPGKNPDGTPGGVGLHTIAVANADPEEWLPTSPALPWYPYGSKVTVYSNDGKVVYTGTVRDTGAGWDVNHHNVHPGNWIDIWLPTRTDARNFGKQNLTVKIVYPPGKGPL